MARIRKHPEYRRRRDLQTVVLTRPRCPRCASIDLRRYKSFTDQGDGSALYYVRCNNPDCLTRFRLLLE